MSEKTDVVGILKALGFNTETKADEVMHTGNTGFGAEFVPSEILADTIFDLVPQRSRLLPLLPGSHGTGLPAVYKTPVKALSNGDLAFSGKTEWTTGNNITSGDGTKQPTKVATITQAQFIAKVDISDEQLKYNAVNTEQYVRDRLVDGMAYTVDAVIINGDSETGGSGNVNLDDAAPTAGAYYLSIDHGIRELAINNSYTDNAGTLDDGDFMTMLGHLGEYAENPEDCLFVTNRATYNKAVQLDEVVTVDKLGPNATIATGVLAAIYGVDVLTHRAVPKTEADGKVSTTSSNNTLGQILAVYKPAIQYGFGQNLKIEVVRVAGYGFQLVATFDFGFQIVDGEASLDDATVAAAINVTI